VELGEGFDVVELPVQAGSELADVRVAESDIRERTGANIVGAWFRGEFVSPPSPDAYIDEQTILLVAGHEEQLERVKELTLSEQRRRRPGHVIVAGYGMVGATVRRAIEDADQPIDTVSLDREDREGVDIVGDVTDVEALERADIDSAGTVILALPDDTATVFATLVVRDCAPDVEIVARAETTESVRKLYRAGADYVLSLSVVSGRMLAATILQEDVISFGQGIEVIRTGGGALAGRTLRGADVRARTGCTVVAVERDGEFIADLDPDFTIREGDELIVAGTDDDVSAFVGLIDGG
jgi:Trk K+ transport system NAD-binding subunit